MHEATKNNTIKIDPSLLLTKEILSYFICPICKYIVSEPRMDACECTKLYCKNCLEEFIKSHGNICFVCGKKYLKEPIYVPWLENHIKQFEMNCKNILRGCNWVGKLGDYNAHLINCMKEQIACPNIGCNEMILREDFDSHIEKCRFNTIICNLCGLKINKEEIKKHDLECLKKEILCPHNCGDKFKKAELKDHLKKCKMNQIDCPFKAVGCTDKIQINKINENDKNNESHLNLLLVDYLKFKEKIINKLELNKNDFNNIENTNHELSKKQNNIDIIGAKYNINIINSENTKKIEIKDKKNLFNKRSLAEQNYKIIENDSYENNKNKMNEKIIIDKFCNFNQSDENLNCDEKKNNYLGKKRENEKFHSYQEINPFLDKEEKNKNIYNIKDLNEGFKITGNIVSANHLDGTTHCFVFADNSKKIKADSSGSFTVKFHILQENKWLALGFCDKKKVEMNNFVFAVRDGKESNGCFIISTNYMIWHCVDRKQRKKISLPEGVSKLQTKNIEFECRYTPLECLIDFYVNDKFLASLKDVRPLKSQYLTPCIIFLKNCEVQTTFDY